jgi:hypothetical protein
LALFVVSFHFRSPPFVEVPVDHFFRVVVQVIDLVENLLQNFRLQCGPQTAGQLRPSPEFRLKDHFESDLVLVDH